LAASDDFSGLGLPTEKPRLNTAANLSRFELTPTEGFVLSRIDGRTSYEEICRMSTLGREETLKILRKLKRDLLILGSRDKVVPIGPRKPQRTEARSSPPGRSRKTPPPVLVTDEMLRKAQEQAGGKAAPAEPEIPSVLDRLDDGSPVEPAELIDGHGLPVETKRRIVRLYRRLRKLAPHELLGVPENADKAAIKRAFAAASKELHPDRHFGKDLGGFREKLAKIFARMTEAVQELEKARKGK
jgi:DnaJ-domain-containing protein 1